MGTKQSGNRTNTGTCVDAHAGNDIGGVGTEPVIPSQKDRERIRRRKERFHDARTNPDHFVGVPSSKDRSSKDAADKRRIRTRPPIAGW